MMAPFLSLSFSLAFSLVAIHTLVNAIPAVIPIPLAESCSSYPLYDPSTGIAGPWTVKLNNCENSAIEGFGDNSQLIRRTGDTGIHKGRVCIYLSLLPTRT